MTNTLSEIHRILEKSRLWKGEIGYLFAQIRIVLEEERLKEKYPHLNLYCNWMLHPRLSTSATCFQILERLTDLFLKAVSIGYKENEIHERITEIISIPKFRQETIQFLKEHSLPIAAFTIDQNWAGTFSIVAQILIDRPLAFPEPDKISNNKRRAILERARSKASGTNFFIREFAFTKVKNRLFWKVLASHDYIDIIGPVLWNDEPTRQSS